MSEPLKGPSRELEDALSTVQARWDGARTERTLAELSVRHGAPRHRRRSRGVAWAAAMAVAMALALGGWLMAREPTPLASSDAGSTGASAAKGTTTPGAGPAYVAASSAAHGETTREAAEELRLADGSSVAMLEPRTRVAVEHSDANLMALSLDAGHALFQVTRRPTRIFRVMAGDVRVEVLGTTFELERGGSRTHVRVHEGRVAVSWGTERRELAAGEAGWFPPTTTMPTMPTMDGAHAAAPVAGTWDPVAGSALERDEAPRDQARRDSDRRTRRATTGSWREHAEQGEFRQAYGLLKAEKAGVASNVHELLLAADAARLSGHPGEALPYLRRVMDEHASDARAPLAAFTLGGVLMNQLGLPREAEIAYATARKRTHSPALAQDALARQVEAAHRAGDEALARALAEQYLREYPRGRRVQAVRRFGGVP